MEKDLTIALLASLRHIANLLHDISYILLEYKTIDSSVYGSLHSRLDDVFELLESMEQVSGLFSCHQKRLKEG